MVIKDDTIYEEGDKRIPLVLSLTTANNTTFRLFRSNEHASWYLQRNLTYGNDLETTDIYEAVKRALEFLRDENIAKVNTLMRDTNDYRAELMDAYWKNDPVLQKAEEG